MNFDLTEEQRAIKQMVRDFAEREVAPVAEELDENEEFPYEIVRKMGDLGLIGLPFPDRYGGGGGDTVSYAIAVEEMARVDSSLAITMAANISLGGEIVRVQTGWGVLATAVGSQPLNAPCCTGNLQVRSPHAAVLFKPGAASRHRGLDA